MPLTEHPLRASLHQEAHLRLFLPIPNGSLCSSWVMMGAQSEQFAALGRMCQVLGLPAPTAGISHYVGSKAGLQLRWFVHTEFVRFTLVRPKGGALPFAETAWDILPEPLLEGLPGELMVLIHAEVLPALSLPLDYAALADDYFAGHDLIGGELGPHYGLALTDLHLHRDAKTGQGASRLLLFNRSMGAKQCGRMLQRVLEIETYRLMALLGLSLARPLLPLLSALERQLGNLTARVEAGTSNERELLNELSRLAARIEDSLAQTSYRFHATRAYYALIQRRLQELHETRLPGVQPLQEFIDSRLAPAIDTCQSVAQRQEALSERLERTTALLRTRVEVESETQREGLLISMNRRAQIQLRLQETVEGLSVVVLTYYLVGLIGYAAKALAALGVPAKPEVITAAAIVPAALLVFMGARRLKKRLMRKLESEAG